MSSKKHKKKIYINANQNNNQKTTTEILNKQLETEDEPSETPSNSITILAEYERQAEEAEQRRAERQRQAELEKAEKERRASTPAILPDPPTTMPEYRPRGSSSEEKDDAPQEDDGQDVKQFVPKNTPSKKAENKPDNKIGDALSEEYDDISGDTETEDNEGEASDEKTAAKPNRFYLVFAVFVIIMSVIGVISSVSFISGIISNIANRTELKNELALFLYPIVSVDPPDCDSPEDLPSTIIIESSIWKIILTGDNSNYSKQYNTYMYVPAIDVEFSVRSIFGSSVEIKHQTVGTADMAFTYIEDMNSYLVPINPHYTAYSPRITEVTNVGDLYTVTVEYIEPSALAVEGIEFENSAVKTMIYTLIKKKGETTLRSIRNITRYGSTNEY